MTDVPTFGSGDACVSYSAPFASSLRNSRVEVARQRLSVLLRIPLQGTEIIQGIYSLVVSPDGEHAALSWTGRVTLLRKTGEQTVVYGSPYKSEVMALNDNIVLMGHHTAWTGQLLDLGSAKTGGLDVSGVGTGGLVRRVDARRHVVVIERDWVLSGHRPPRLAAFLESAELDRRGIATDRRWVAKVDGESVAAAIGADGYPVVAMADKSLHLFSPRADARGHPSAAAHHKLAFLPQDMSLVPPFIMLTEQTASGTRLHALRGNGAEAWAVDVPISVRQPPVEGGQGRVYLVGNGIATIDNGQLTSSQASEVPLYASAFADGSLVVVAEKELRFVSRSGAPEGKLEALEPLLTPPAIAGDGSVWVASGEAVYVAR